MTYDLEYPSKSDNFSEFDKACEDTSCQEYWPRVDGLNGTIFRNCARFFLDYSQTRDKRKNDETCRLGVSIDRAEK